METTMTIADWLMIIAVFTGPIVAVRLTRHLDSQNEIKSRKLNIFKTLMATRAYSMSLDHVLALNKIDLEFHSEDRKEKNVISAWKAYLDFLGDKSITIDDKWGQQRVSLLVELLHTMAIVLDYDFDKTHIKNSSYSPVAHTDIEAEQQTLRSGLIEILESKRTIPMEIVKWPSEKNNS